MVTSAVSDALVRLELRRRRRAELAQKLRQRRSLRLGQAGGGALHRLRVLREDPADQLRALRRQRDDARASIGVVEAGRDELARLEPIDGDGGGAAREVDALADAGELLR